MTTVHNHDGAAHRPVRGESGLPRRGFMARSSVRAILIAAVIAAVAGLVASWLFPSFAQANSDVPEVTSGSTDAQSDSDDPSLDCLAAPAGLTDVDDVTAAMVGLYERSDVADVSLLLDFFRAPDVVRDKADVYLYKLSVLSGDDYGKFAALPSGMVETSFAQGTYSPSVQSASIIGLAVDSGHWLAWGEGTPGWNTASWNKNWSADYVALPAPSKLDMVYKFLGGEVQDASVAGAQSDDADSALSDFLKQCSMQAFVVVSGKLADVTLEPIEAISFKSHWQAASPGVFE